MQQVNDDLRVISKAIDLIKHTIKLTSNCKKFPKKYRFTLCDRMQNKAMKIYEFLLEANRTPLGCKSKRYELQTKAIWNCDELITYIQICLDLDIIESSSAEHWSKLVCDIKYMAIKWRTTDKER